MKKKVAIYGRTSTEEQNVESQLQGVKRYCENQDWEIAKEYIDKGISGAKDGRPALDELKRDCQKRKVKTVVVYKFDRIARSTSHLLEVLNLFQRYNVDFISVTEGIDTSTSVGKMVFTFLGAIAEFERNLIQERVKSGIKRAQDAGTHCGRPRTGFDIKKAMRLRKQGLGYKQIAKQLAGDVSHMTVYRYLKEIEG